MIHNNNTSIQINCIVYVNKLYSVSVSSFYIIIYHFNGFNPELSPLNFLNQMKRHLLPSKWLTFIRLA